MLIAGVILFGYLLLAKRNTLKLTAKQYLSLGLLGFFSIYLTNILEFWGLQHLTAAKTCFLYSLSPFFAAFFSYIHFKEKMTSRKWLGMGIGFLGFIPVLLTQTGSEELFSSFSLLSLPSLAIMAAALFSVYGWILLRVVVKDNDISPLVANGYSMCFGGALALMHSMFIDNWNPIPVVPGHLGDVVKGVLIMTLISNIVCYNLYGMMLKRFTATFLSFMGLLSPIFASLSGWIFLGERPSWIIFASTLVVSLGLWIVYNTEKKQGYILSKENESKIAP